jgi:predicted patatin/cPLA2 family phospholipase
MRKPAIIVAACMVCSACAQLMAQSMDDLNIQIHGYATQAVLYTTQNNMFTMSTSDGSAAWTEAVLNVSSQPIPKLRIGVQGHYYILGNIGDSLVL